VLHVVEWDDFWRAQLVGIFNCGVCGEEAELFHLLESLGFLALVDDRCFALCILELLENLVLF
jgi:hypothetical protein